MGGRSDPYYQHDFQQLLITNIVIESVAYEHLSDIITVFSTWRRLSEQRLFFKANQRRMTGRW